MIDQMGRVLLFRAQKDRTVVVEAQYDDVPLQSVVFSLDHSEEGCWFHLLHDDSKELWIDVKKEIGLAKAERGRRKKVPRQDRHWPTQDSARLGLKTLSILVALGAARRAKSELRTIDIFRSDPSLRIIGWKEANQIPTDVRRWLPDRTRNKSQAWLAECWDRAGDGNPDSLLCAQLVNTEALFDPDLSPRDAADVVPAALRWIKRYGPFTSDHRTGIPAGAARKRSRASPALQFVNDELLAGSSRHSILLPSWMDFRRVVPERIEPLARAAAAVFEAHELRRKPQAADTREGPRAKLALALTHTARVEHEGPRMGEATDLAELVHAASRQRTRVLAEASRGDGSSVELGVHLLIGTELALLYRYDFEFCADAAIIAETAKLLRLHAEGYAAWAQWRVKEVLLASAAWSNQRELFADWFPGPPGAWVHPMISAMVSCVQVIGKAQAGVLFTDTERSEVEYRVLLAAGVVYAAFPRRGIDPAAFFNECAKLPGRDGSSGVLDVYRAMASDAEEDRNKWIDSALEHSAQTPGFFQNVAAYLSGHREIPGWRAITMALQKR